MCASNDRASNGRAPLPVQSPLAATQTCSRCSRRGMVWLVYVRAQLKRHSSHRASSLSTWIRRTSISRIGGAPSPEQFAHVFDHRGDPLGVGLYSPDSEITIRMLHRGAAPLEANWLERRVHAAIQRRATLMPGGTTGYREINAEGDGLPGLTVDRYGTHRVVQITTAPMFVRRDEIARALDTIDPRPTTWLVPATASKREAIPTICEGPSVEALHYRELGLELETDPPPAQKTGAYHDQRENRARVAEIAQRHGGRLLDLGCHIGGFSLHAAARGVSCVAVDQSEAALTRVASNAAKNNLGSIVPVRADIFRPLEHPELQGTFGAIVFDPPKMASAARDVNRALDAMERTLSQLIPRLDPGGTLIVCSCSHHLDITAIDRAIARTSVRIAEPMLRIERRGPGLDHPCCPFHPEGGYLSVGLYTRRS